MIVNFSPIRMDEQLVVEREDDIITLNGEAFDLSPLLEGASLPSTAIESKWFVGDIDRENGVISLTLVLPHGANAPIETRFPTAITLTENGPVQMPIYDIVEEVIEEDEPDRLDEDDNSGDENPIIDGDIEEPGQPTIEGVGDPV